MFPEHFSISNFKCFKEPTTISLRPITLNIGPNNSGKSSFIKIIELFKQSIENNHGRYNQALFNEDYKTFITEVQTFGFQGTGSPSEFLNNIEKNLEIAISPIYSDFLEGFRYLDIKLGLSYKFDSKRTNFSVDPDSISKHSPLQFSGVIIPELPGRGILLKYVIYIDGKLLLSIEIDENTFDIGNHGFIPANDAHFKFNVNLINKLFNKSIDFNLNDEYTTSNSYFSDDSFYILEKFLNKMKEVINENELIPFKNELLKFLNDVFEGCLDFNKFIKKTTAISLERRQNERYIKVNNGSLFKKALDACFFDSKENKAGRIRGIIKDILPLFNFPEKFKLEASPDYGFIFKLETGDGNYRNIADFGSGINQLLPLFIIGAASDKSDVLIIEEPEVNLHPNFQSTLADMFSILYNGRGMQFIIETHSEYMIRRFQYLVAKGKVKPEDIIINYFWIDNGTHKCKQIEFKPDGGLTKSFEPGFYEVGLSLQLELLKINSLN